MMFTGALQDAISQQTQSISMVPYTHTNTQKHTHVMQTMDLLKMLLRMGTGLGVWKGGRGGRSRYT